jgi:hypothetical protein
LLERDTGNGCYGTGVPINLQIMGLLRITLICLVTLFTSCNFRKSPDLLLSLPIGIEINELKDKYLVNNVKCDTIYDPLENKPENTIRFFPVEFVGLPGVLVVHTNSIQNTVSRYDWYMDSTAGWLFTIRNNPLLQKHATSDDYTKIRAFISSKLKSPTETTDTSLFYAADSLLIVYSRFQKSITMNKPSNRYKNYHEDYWMFSAPLQENFLTTLRVGQSRKEIESSSVLEDTLIFVGKKQLKLERKFCNVWGIPSEVFFHFNSDQHLDYAAWRHIFDYRNVINGDFFISDLERILGQPLKSHEHSLFWKFEDSKIVFDISVSQEVSYEMASDTFLEFLKL